MRRIMCCISLSTALMTVHQSAVPESQITIFEPEYVAAGEREYAPETTTCENAFVAPRSLSVRRLIGVRVVNPLDEALGEIKDLILSENGCVEKVVVLVGGFLGFGGKSVYLPAREVEINENLPEGNLVAVVRQTRDNILKRSASRNSSRE